MARLCSVGLAGYISLANIESLAVGAFELVNCSLSVVGFVPSLALVSKCRMVSKCRGGRFVGYMDVAGLQDP